VQVGDDDMAGPVEQMAGLHVGRIGPEREAISIGVDGPDEGRLDAAVRRVQRNRDLVVGQLGQERGDLARRRDAELAQVSARPDISSGRSGCKGDRFAHGVAALSTVVGCVRTSKRRGAFAKALPSRTKDKTAAATLL
jgi:hypothetical protein